MLGAANLAADGALGRWLSRRLRHWSQSYQARLTLVLFGFFVVPAVVFAVWSYRRLQRDHETTRAFVVREALRLASSRPDMRDPEADASGTGLPLLAYRDGALTSVSDPLYRELAPIGRFLDPPIAQSLMFGDEATASKPYLVGQTPTLFGFRALEDGAQGRRTVVATAARGGELDLDRQRRDLTVLVLVVTALGALAALALSSARRSAVSTAHRDVAAGRPGHRRWRARARTRGSPPAADRIPTSLPGFSPHGDGSRGE